MRRCADVSVLGRGRVLYLKGSPYEQGKQLGRGAADLVRENLRRAMAPREEMAAGRDLTDYNGILRENERFVAREFPELLEELAGIAEGAEVDYGQLLHMNLNVQLSYVHSTELDCTQVLATGPATADGKSYIGKTRDLRRGPLLQLLLHREFEGGGFANELMTAGRMNILDAVNQDGLSLTCSGQWSPRVRVDVSRADSAWLLLNLQPIIRRARSVEEAVEMVKEQPRASGMIVTVADGTGAAVLEVTDRAVRRFEPENGLLVRTNHYFHPDLKEITSTPEENPSSYARHARASELLRQRHGSISVHDILRILSDHTDPPSDGSICRHGDGERESRTCGAVINCPQDRVMWGMLGNPCEGIQALGRPGE